MDYPDYLTWKSEAEGSLVMLHIIMLKITGAEAARSHLNILRVYWQTNTKYQISFCKLLFKREILYLKVEDLLKFRELLWSWDQMCI